MDKAKVSRLKRRLSALRAKGANIRSRELKSLAKALGRRHHKQRGREPTWISEALPESTPISIPDHPGAMNKYTAGNILDQLEEDIFMFEEMLREESR